MKAFLKKSLSLLLVAALFLAVVPAAVLAEEPIEKGELKVGVISDIHFYADENVDDPVEMERVCRQTISTSFMSEALLFSALTSMKDKIDKGMVDCVFLPGDLTRNGDMVSMKKLAQIMEKFEKDTGVPVYVTNGNHDINNHRAEVFRNGAFQKINECVTADQFRAIFKNLGFDMALDTYTPPKGKEAGALSYYASLPHDYRLLVLDGGRYSPDNTEKKAYSQETGGKLSDDLLNWAVEKTERATGEGRTVLGMTHWNLIPHFTREISLFKDFCMVDCEYVRDRLADAGMNYCFTGHLHCHDIASYVSDNGNIFYDIATASMLNFPNYYRVMTFDNSQEGKVTVSDKTYSVDDILPVTVNGKTYPQPIRYTTFGINYTGNGAKSIAMGFIEHYAETYLPQIEAEGGLYNFLTKQLDLENLYTSLLKGGVKFGSLTVFGAKNLLGLTKNLCDQIDRAYISDPEKVYALASDLLDELLNIQISDVPCTKFIEEYGFGDPNKGGTIEDLGSSALIYLYAAEYDVSDDAFVQDAFKHLETGEVSTKLLDVLLDKVLYGLLENELLSTLKLNLASAFPFGTIGFLLARGLDTFLQIVTMGRTSFMNIINTGFRFLNTFRLIEYKSVNDILYHYMDEYLTESQMQTVDGEILSIVSSLCGDNSPGRFMDMNVTLEANTAGGYEVEKTSDNLRLPSNVSVTFGKNADTSRTISWFTKHAISGTDIQLASADSYGAGGLSSTLPTGVTVEKKYEKVIRQIPGIDIGVFGILPYSFAVGRHTLTVNGLQPGTTYYYRIGDAQRGFWSDVATLTTADNSDSFTFLHTSDCQAGLEKQYQNWATVLETAFTNHPDAAFLMSSGDQVDQGDNFNQWKWMFNANQPRMMSTVMMPASGNHEEKGTDAIINNFVLSNAPQQNTEEGVYYSFDYNNAHFMVLNSNNLNSKKGLSDDQINWLKQDASASKKQWKIVMLHKAVYSNGSHYDDKDVVAIRSQLATLMPQLGVDVVLQGHDHVYLRTDALNKNRVVKYDATATEFNGSTYPTKINPNGTIYVIDACSGVKYYKTKDEAATDKLFPRAEKIVDASYPVYGAFTIKGNQLFFNAYGVNPETGSQIEIDSFSILKK